MPLSKIGQSKHTIKKMVEIYCKDFHNTYNNSETFCTDCDELLKYSETKLDRCPFGEKKPPCAKCTIHCYKIEMKNKIQVVMRYSGPRMIFIEPITAIYHLFSIIKWKKFLPIGGAHGE